MAYMPVTHAQLMRKRLGQPAPQGHGTTTILPSRKTARERGYNTQWDKYAKQYLKSHPLCVNCLKKGITKAAQCVDHIIPIKRDISLFWEPTNHQALCLRCNTIKAQTE